MWKEAQDQLERDFKFKNFVEAFGFLTQVAMLAEKRDHHPTIANTYNQVKITLSTHDAGDKVTDKDRELAGAIDKLVDK